jgi:hypothetical protein
MFNSIARKAAQFPPLETTSVKLTTWPIALSLTLAFGSMLPICHGGKKPQERDAKPIVIEGQLDANDAKDTSRKGSPAKLHKVKLQQGTPYVIDLVSTAFDAYLRLEAADGKQLAEDDDGGGGTNARLFFIPPASAEYTLVATSFHPKTGKYRLTVQEAHLEVRKLKLEDASATVTDRLALTDGRSPFSPHNVCKIYRVELKAGKVYVIDLESQAFDAYLTLSDASLVRIASDDDSGGGRNARIRFDCKTEGAYYLVATGLGRPEGDFEIRIRAEK